MDNEEIFIDVVDVIEESDGGATIILHANNPAREFLMREGVLSILKNTISNMEGFEDEKGTQDRTCGSDVGCRCRS